MKRRLWILTLPAVLVISILVLSCDNPTQSNTSNSPSGGGTQPPPPDSQMIMGFWTRQGDPSETLHFTSASDVFVQMPTLGSGSINYSLNSSTKRLTFSGTYFPSGGGSSFPFTVVYSYSLSSTTLILTVVSVNPPELSGVFASQSTFNKSS